MEVIILKYVQLICVTMFFTNNANCDKLDMKNTQSDQNLFKTAGCIANCMEDQAMILKTCYKVCSDKVLELPDVKRINRIKKTTLKLHCRDSSRLVMKLDDPHRLKEDILQRTYLLKIQETKNEYSERFIFITGDSIIEIDNLASSTSFSISASVVNSKYEYEYIIGNEIFTTLRERYGPENVTNITFSQYFINEKNDGLFDVIINWTPARDATCFYDILIWAQISSSNLQTYEVREYMNLYTYKLEGLTHKTNYWVSVRGINTKFDLDGAIKWIDIETPSCIHFHDNINDCAPEHLNNITVNEKHIYGDLYDISISWDTPAYNPEYYNIKIIDLKHLLNNNQVENISVEFNVTGDAVYALASQVFLTGPHQEITISVVSSGGVTKNVIIIDLDRQNSHNQQSRFFILLFILFGCVAIVLGLFAWRKSVSRLNDVKQQQILELQLKVQTNINKTAELDLIKNVSLKSLDVLRHLVDDPMEIPQDKVTIYNEIGVGEFGLVKRGVVTLSPNGLKLDVAVKMLKQDLMRDEKCLFEFRREIDMMKSVGKHPNILGIIGHCTANIETLMLFTEFSDNGNLLDFLRLEWKQLNKANNDNHGLTSRKVSENVFNFNTSLTEKKSIFYKMFNETVLQSDGAGIFNMYNENTYNEDQNYISPLANNRMYFSECEYKPGPENYLNLSDNVSLTESDLLSYGKQVSFGMKYLAEKKIIHRDLAARNVLVFDRECVKISDFGLSRDVYQENVYQKTGNGKLPIKWLALESLTHQVYTSESDVWSFGILMYEIVTLGCSPYPSTPPNDLLSLLKAGYRMEKPVHCSDTLYSFIKSCWSENTNDRPTFKEACCKIDELMLNKSEATHIDLSKINPIIIRN